MKVTNNRSVKLSGDAHLLLVISALFTIAGLLSNTFVNVYIWRVDKSYVPVALFNMVNFVATPLMFVLAGWLSKRFDRVLALRIGIAVQLCFYVLVLIFRENAAHHVLWLGCVLGSGGGFYWLAFNLLSFEMTDPANRKRFSGVNGIFGSLGGMVAPMIAGWLIARMADFRGYHLLFALSGLLFAGAVAVSFKLPRQPNRGTFHLITALKGIKGDWARLMVASGLFGIREGVLAFYIGLLVYLVTKSEMGLGKFALVTSGVSLVMFFIVDKVLGRSLRKTRISMIVGAGVMAAGAVALCIKVSYVTLIIFGILTAIGTPFFTVPFGAMVYDEIGESRVTHRYRVEYIIVREIFLNAGRILSILAFLAVWSLTRSTFALQILILVIGSVQLLSWFFIQSVEQESGRGRTA